MIITIDGIELNINAEEEIVIFYRSFIESVLDHHKERFPLCSKTKIDMHFNYYMDGEPYISIPGYLSEYRYDNIDNWGDPEWKYKTKKNGEKVLKYK